MREAGLRPARVSTGRPARKALLVVTPPLYGQVSRCRSAWRWRCRCCAKGQAGAKTIREGSTPRSPAAAASAAGEAWRSTCNHSTAGGQARSTYIQASKIGGVIL